MPKISLITATVDRTSELERFLSKLEYQDYMDFELIVVDQNPDERLIPMLNSFSDRFEIKHIRTEKRGVSRARNLGIQQAQGEIITFPDDDCWYPPGLLQRVEQEFDRHPEFDGIIGLALDEAGRPSMKKFPRRRRGKPDKYSVWTMCNTSVLFFRRHLVESTGLFNESLGVGSGTPWGAAEDVEYPLRAMRKGFCLYYEPAIIVGHPQPVKKVDERALRRAYSYGAGLGKVVRDFNYPLWFILYQFLRPAGASFFWLLMGKKPRAYMHFLTLKGRIYGWSHQERDNEL
ncbi:glycosyltransferase family 2 protein [Syntrophomonas palmitatica]|uniref:glycosyltransferase family 2 protein n=1 Tax=Syntrophomonas palmitatica TaxID=402877 RepID=UPI0006CF6983|nr:glycosyltransferase family A protein [Syntrophomonas palmitatica]